MCQKALELEFRGEGLLRPPKSRKFCGSEHPEVRSQKEVFFLGSRYVEWLIPPTGSLLAYLRCDYIFLYIYIYICVCVFLVYVFILVQVHNLKAFCGSSLRFLVATLRGSSAPQSHSCRPNLRRALHLGGRRFGDWAPSKVRFSTGPEHGHARCRCLRIFVAS